MATIIQQPDSLSLSGNIKPFIVTSGSPISFVLKIGSDVIFEAKYEAGTTIALDVQQLVEDKLIYKMIASDFYQQDELVKTFTALIDEVSYTFRAIRCGVANLADTPSNWLNLNFLTWQPQNKAVTYYSPEWLTYYAVSSGPIKLKAYFEDGTSQTITIGSTAAGCAYTVNVQYASVSGRVGGYPTHFEVWAENGSGTRLTYIQRYYYSEPMSEDEQWFLFENSLGGLDTARCYGNTDFDGEHEHKLSTISGITSETRINTKRNYSKNTGHLSDYERRWMLDLFPARQKYIYALGAIRKIVVVESDVKYATSDLPSNYTFKYRFADDSAALLNLIRNADAIPDGIAVPDIESPDFFLPPRLAELPRVTLGEGVLIPAFDPSSETPQITTIGAILSALVDSVMSRIPGADGTAGTGGQLVNLLKENDILGASDGNVFSGLRTLKEIAALIAENNSSMLSAYLSRVDNDTASGLITFLQGILLGNAVNEDGTPKYKINGDGSAVFSDVSAKDAVLSGSLTAASALIQGLLKAETAEIAGLLKAATAEIAGLLKAASAEIAGSLKAGSADITTVLKTPSLTSFTFVPGFLGSGYKLSTDAQGITELEIDKLLVRKSMTVYELIKHKISHVGGAFLFSPASAEITKVTDGGTYYRCDVKNKENNFFTAGALALCQIFNSNALTYKRYWRAVTSVSADGSYVNLSKADCEAGSAAPEAGDTIVQLGHKTNTALQHARLISSYGSEGAYDQFLEGINSYSLAGKVTQQIGRNTFFNVESLKIKSGGVPHQTPVDKGMWIAGRYFYYDRVHHAGSWWICTAVYTDAEPGTNSEWQRQSERSSSYAELNVEKDRINLLVDKQTETDGTLASMQSEIAQNASSIALKVSQTEYDADKTVISQMQSEIAQNASSIALKVSQTEYDADKTVISQMQSEIAQNASSIALKVSQTEYDADKTVISQMQSEIAQNASSIALKVSQTEYDADKTVISQMQSEIAQNASSIALKVSQTEYDADQEAVEMRMSSIEQDASGISLKVSQMRAGAPNLIVNSDFSKSTQDWQLNNAPPFSRLKKGDEPDGSGEYVVQISSYSGIYSQLISFSTSNNISFWVKRESVVNFNLELKIGTSSAVGSTILTLPLPNHDKWVKVELPYSLASAGMRNIQFYCTNSNVSYSIAALRINNTAHAMTWTKIYPGDNLTWSSRMYGLFSGAYSAGKFVTTTANSGPWKLWSFPTGRKYTLSFYVRADGSYQLQCGYESDLKTISVGTGWQYFAYTFFSQESDSAKNIIFYLRSAGTFWLTNIMLVEGENAAAWQPSASELKADLLATGIDIENKKVTVTADTFILRDNNGVERAVFNENFKLDAFGNMTINSLRTPFARITNFSTHNFDQYPNAVFVPPAGTGTLTLPNLEKHNGLTINLLFDAFYDSWSTATAVSEIWKLQGFFMDQNGNRFLDMPFHRMERTFLSITGVWTGTRIMWIVRDKISHILTAGYAPDQNTWTYRNVPELIKSGELVCAGVIDSSGVFVNQDSRLVGDFTLYKDASCIQIIFPSIVRVNAAGTTSSYTISDNDFHIDVRPKAFNRVAAAQYSTPYRAFLAYQYSLIDISQYIFGDFTFEIRALRDFHQLYNL